MKNKFIPLLPAIILLSVPGCNNIHSHSFTVQETKEELLASPATCEEAAKYYLSCSCGEHSEETFESGEPLGHSFENGSCSRCSIADLDYKLSENGEFYIVNGLKETIPSEVNVASTFNKLPVKQIGNEIFKDKTGIKKILIPPSITSIGDNCFENCSDLETLCIQGEDVTYGSYIIKDCPKIKHVEISSLVNGLYDLFEPLVQYNYGEAIPTRENHSRIVETLATEDNSGKYYYIPNSLTEFTINKGVPPFNLCDKNSPDKFPILQMEIKSSTEIPEKCFYLNSIMEKMILPNNIKEIKQEAFRYCHHLKDINLPEGLTSIGARAFYENFLLDNLVFPNSLNTIDEYSFLNCSGIKNMTFGNSSQLTTIKAGAFGGCYLLSSITFPDSLTTLCYRSFSECTGLTSVIIPSSCTIIEEEAFKQTTCKVFFKGTEKPETWHTNAFTSENHIYYYSESSNPDGNHWHYVNNVPEIWA